MTKNDGDPAFPHDGQANYTGGMSLRDWFAGMALQGIISNPETSESKKYIAGLAYEFADFMIVERESADGKEK